MLAKKGQWVEILKVLLEPEARPSSLPPDTRTVPLEARIKGFLVEDACLGEMVTVETILGRRVSGRLIAIQPAYQPTFGSPVPELLTVGQELRSLLDSERREL